MRQSKWDAHPGLKEEIRDLRLNQKKTLKEIRAYCLEKGVKAFDGDIIKICGKTAYPAGPDLDTPEKPKRTRKQKKAVHYEDDLMSAVSELELEIQHFCSRVRKVARREIIKYIARIRKARRSMGEVISKEEEDRLSEQLRELDIDNAEIKEINFTEGGK